MLNITDYCSSGTIWPGIFSYVQEHFEKYDSVLPDPFTEDDLLKMLKKNAKVSFSSKEYDSFRKAVSALKKGIFGSLKKENLYRLCFALRLDSDTQAQDLFLNYLHQNELSARSLDEFIIIAALKMGLSWEKMGEICENYKQQILSQPVSPDTLNEGDTAEVYYSVINERIQTCEDLTDFLNEPENLGFFAKTRNTQYLALFDDVELETIYNADNEKLIKLVTDYGSSEKETVQEYYYSLFGLRDDSSEENLSEQEISVLCNRFENVFMTYDNFCLLVQRKRPVDISSGMFMLNLLKKLLTEDADMENDFYVNFLDPDEFVEVCNDILIYFGFPILNPVCDGFDRLLLDVYKETLEQNTSAVNPQIQKLYMQNLRKYLKMFADEMLKQA